MNRNLAIRHATEIAIGLAKSSDLSATSFTVHCSSKSYAAALRSGDAVSYLSKNLKRNFRKHGVPTDHVWFSLELVFDDKKTKRPHLHGLALIPATLDQNLKSALGTALGGISKVQSIARKRHTQETYSAGWSSYCTKVTKKVTDLIGRGSLYISRGFTRLIKEEFGKTKKSKSAAKPVATVRLADIFRKGLVSNVTKYFSANNSTKPTHNPTSKKTNDMTLCEDTLIKQFEAILSAPDDITEQDLGKEIRKCCREDELEKTKTE